jgi:hypothetical protein
VSGSGIGSALPPTPFFVTVGLDPTAQGGRTRTARKSLKSAHPRRRLWPPPELAAEPDETPEAFRARAIKLFAATFAAAPPHLHAALERLTPRQWLALIDHCWPKDDAFDELPQGP